MSFPRKTLAETDNSRLNALMSQSQPRQPSKIPRTRSTIRPTSSNAPSNHKNHTSSTFDVNQVLNQFEGMRRLDEEESEKELIRLDSQIAELHAQIERAEFEESEHHRHLNNYIRETEALEKRLKELDETIGRNKLKFDNDLKHFEVKYALKLEEHSLELKKVYDSTIEEFEGMLKDGDSEIEERDHLSKVADLKLQISGLQRELLEKKSEITSKLQEEREKKDTVLDSKLANVREMSVEPRSQLKALKSELLSVEKKIASCEADVMHQQLKQQGLVNKMKNSRPDEGTVEQKIAKLDSKKHKLEEDIDQRRELLLDSSKLEKEKRVCYETRKANLEHEQNHVRKIEHQIYEHSKTLRVFARVVGKSKFFKTSIRVPYTEIEHAAGTREILTFEKVFRCSETGLEHLPELRLLVRECLGNCSVSVIEVGTALPDLPTMMKAMEYYYDTLSGQDRDISFFRYSFSPEGQFIDVSTGKVCSGPINSDGKFDVSSVKSTQINSKTALNEVISNMEAFENQSSLFGMFVHSGYQLSMFVQLKLVLQDASQFTPLTKAMDSLSKLVAALYENTKTQTVVSVDDSGDDAEFEWLKTVSQLRLKDSVGSKTASEFLV
ncbi:unnamed protein product [Kuraishia capsulata CBS 1993]|uniref:Uncharacterized protein n=1 Tax=Kuraishia capsulata CBS 1993 TaxID=1382522 RepID=W6MXW8_9ASCO|nr:uncharacterized protein KUCA_T00005603001 [Kuraishia capsulata CBS 1993]CDK29610.1 unnamed protein product [Kuraishia capsulata CBS 1993]